MKPVVATIALLLLGACGSGAGAQDNGPESAVRELMSSMESGDCSAVQKIVVTPDAIDCEMIGTLRGGYADDGVDLDAARLSTGDVIDGSSTVTVDLGTDDPDQVWQVQQVDGSWKVLFDSEA